MNETFLYFFEECKTLRGYKNAIIYDLVRSNNSNSVPISYYDFVMSCKKKSMEEMIKSVDSSELDIFNEYIDFSVENEFAMILPLALKDNFISFPTEIDFPSFCDNAILGLYDTTDVNFTKIIEHLENLNVLALEIRINQAELTFLDNIELIFSDSSIETISLKIKTFHRDSVDKINVNLLRRIKEIVFYNQFKEENIDSIVKLRRHDVDLFSKISCDSFIPQKVIEKYFFINSQTKHNYFNRKLYIGPNGEIKNAPECPETFGYIQDLENPEELKAIVQTPEFQKYWFVHKEITDVCKDCEFRHMCVDNRLPHQRSENEWYHQTECNYNPYIAKWQGEEGYRNLAECGVISNENGFSIDHEKIAEINKELWGED